MSVNALSQSRTETGQKVVKDRTNLPFLFADPELVERSEAGKDASPEPPAVPPLRCIPRCVDLDLFLKRKIIGETGQDELIDQSPLVASENAHEDNDG